MKLKLSKIEVAEIQLTEAIYLFFDHAHPMIIETLIGAVIGILRAIGKARGIQAPLHDSDKVKSEYKGKWIEHLHKAQNFCKHADRDLNDILDYDTEALSFHIYEACYLYRHLTSNIHLKYKQSTSAIMFELWFGLKYPNLLNDKEEFSKFLHLSGFPQSFTTDSHEMLKLISGKNRIKALYENM
ncbi:hypothetical protein M0R36_03945 [bacterium]|jgi:hypothetical protein|nr:hypothetical protein [bacterium]